MGKLGDFGKAIGKMATMIGAAAMIEAEKSARTQLVAEVGAMIPRRRKVAVDRIRGVLAGDHGLDSKLVRELDRALGVALFEGQGRGVWAALDKAMKAASWNPLQRVAFLQKLVPDARITIENLQLGTPPKPTASPVEAAPETTPDTTPDTVDDA